MPARGARRWLCYCARHGKTTRLIARDVERAAELERDRENKRYLAGSEFPDGMSVHHDAGAGAFGLRMCNYRGAVGSDARGHRWSCR